MDKVDIDESSMSLIDFVDWFLAKGGSCFLFSLLVVPLVLIYTSYVSWCTVFWHLFMKSYYCPPQIKKCLKHTYP